MSEEQVEDTRESRYNKRVQDAIEKTQTGMAGAEAHLLWGELCKAQAANELLQEANDRQLETINSLQPALESVALSAGEREAFDKLLGVGPESDAVIEALATADEE